MSNFMSPSLYASESAVPSIPPAKRGDICVFAQPALVGHKEECEAVDCLDLETKV